MIDGPESEGISDLERHCGRDAEYIAVSDTNAAAQNRETHKGNNMLKGTAGRRCVLARLDRQLAEYSPDAGVHPPLEFAQLRKRQGKTIDGIAYGNPNVGPLSPHPLLVRCEQMPRGRPDSGITVSDDMTARRHAPAPSKAACTKMVAIELYRLAGLDLRWSK
jgi:hypothetical protein